MPVRYDIFMLKMQTFKDENSTTRTWLHESPVTSVMLEQANQYFQLVILSGAPAELCWQIQHLQSKCFKATVICSKTKCSAIVLQKLQQKHREKCSCEQ